MNNIQKVTLQKNCIQDFDLPGLAPYRERSENRLYHWYEPQPGLFIAESGKVIRRALDAGYQPESFLLEDGQEEGVLTESVPQEDGILTENEPQPEGTMCEEQIVPVYIAPKALMETITGYHLTGGALSAMKRKTLPDAEEVIRGARRAAVLDHVTNPTNLGAIVRSAAALGIDAVLFADGCSDPLARRAVRVSMGCIFQMPWTCVPAKQDIMELLRRAGFVTAAMALSEDSIGIDSPRLKEAERLALFLGNEGDGLPEEIVSACDYTVKIPMFHGADSLNVAAAAAVAFWEVSRGDRSL